MLGKNVSCTSGHEKVGRTQFRPVGRMVVDMFSPRRCWSSPRLRNFLLLVQKIRWRTVIASTACFVGETCPWDLGDYTNWNATSNGSIIWGRIRDFVPGTILQRYVVRMEYTVWVEIGSGERAVHTLGCSRVGSQTSVLYDVVEGKPFTFTSVNSRTLIQIELLLIFLRGGGQLWTLEESWTQVGVLTGHSASTADFNWSSSHISVSFWSYFVMVING